MAKKRVTRKRTIDRSRELEETYSVLVRKRLEGKPAEVPTKDVSKVVEDYNNKVMVEVSNRQHQDLIRRGFKIEDLSSRKKIRVGTLAFDPLISKERRKAVGPAKEERAIKTDYYFVQFIGPVKPKWLEDLKKANITPLSYYHDYTYLVYAKKTDINKITRKRHVRSVVPYGHLLKLSEDKKKDLDAEDPVTENKYWVIICTVSDRVEKTLKDMKAMGVRQEGKPMGRGMVVSVLVTMPNHLVLDICKLIDVLQIEPYLPERDMDEVADQVVAGNYNNLNQVVPPAAGQHPYLDWLGDMRVDGTGITVGIVELTTRMDENHPAFTGRINTLSTKGIGYHASMVGGQTAADYRNETDGDGFIYGVGIVPGAGILNQGTQDPVNPDVQCNETVTNAAPNGIMGSVQNNSWGTNPVTDYRQRDADYDRLVRDADANGTPLAICFAAGNSGWAGSGRPSGAKNIISVGNFENYRPNLNYIPPGGVASCIQNDADNIDERYIRSCNDSSTGASSVGSCADGRIKPDIVAPGQWTASANPSVGGAGAGSPRFVSANIVYGGGTSAASPKVAGACALIEQWWRQRHTFGATQVPPSPALLKAMIINGAVDTGEGGPIPNLEQGWGRINLNNVFDPGVAAIYVDQDILIQNNGTPVECDIEPVDTNQPMRISLIWTDTPGDDPSGTAATRALKNAFDLEITQGTDTWFGNNFAGGWSQTGGRQDAIQNVHPNDIVNNVQNVFIQNPAGQYHLDISENDINENCLDPANPTNLPHQQDFALVIQNAKLVNTEPMDVMLAIDRTGSMGGTPITSAKAAAMQFMDLIPTDNNHRAGVVSYSTPCSEPYIPPCNPDATIVGKASVDADLSVVTGALKTNMTDPAGPIGTITAGGCTSIGAGLKMASERIIELGAPLHRKVIILLTDGMENRSPCVEHILPLLRKEYRVHVIALGYINDTIVNQIADETHGELKYTPTEAELASFYHEILATTVGLDMVDTENGSFDSGEGFSDADADAADAESEANTQFKRFPLVKSDSMATFIVGWKKPAVSLDVNLETPNGTLITPSDANNSPSMSYVERDTHVIYTLHQTGTLAQDWEGEWAVRINRAGDSAPDAETYTASLLVRSSLRLKLIWDKLRYYTKDLIRLTAKVIDTQNVLTNGVWMTVQSAVPQTGYGDLLAKTSKISLVRPSVVAAQDQPSASDRFAQGKLGSLYTKSIDRAEISFKMGYGDIPVMPLKPIYTTPHTARLKKHFRPVRDGIYTYRIKVEGNTASGARYTRTRTVSKYVKAKPDAIRSKIDFRPLVQQQPRLLQLSFTPRDLYGNLVGPGCAKDIEVKVDNGILKGLPKDQLDGSYVIEIEATGKPEDMSISLQLDEVSFPVRMPVAVPSIVPLPSIPGERFEGKVEQLRFDENGNFLGFTLRTTTRTVDFLSLSSRLADILAESLEKDLMVIISQDESTGMINDVYLKGP